MKSINNYISEKLVINRNTGKKQQYKYFPETKKELKEIIKQKIEEKGNKCDLNDIDVSEIKDMSKLFIPASNYGDLDISNFNGDISKWNVSNVKYMSSMFAGSNFNGDISNWDVSNVTDMQNMFAGSKFNQDISKWNITKVISMTNMFYKSNFNQDISKWDVRKVEYMMFMFYSSKFNQDISKWNVNKNTDVNNMFTYSQLEGKEKEWWGRTK